MSNIAKFSPFGILSSILSDADKPPLQEPLPTVPEPAVSPVPEADDEAAQKRRRKKAAEIATRGGRLSTLLSDDSGADKLGSN